ncbi:phosphopantothenoylcysteine decarboxylase/phosphopantothenate--cysteine ligase [Candidatus Endolissoclinum faulkneri L2]|uniref:Coenzyme A biosynthesis bifunctional protein CoaBC n=1 Tax=Candidatus Endolissoclinum faulkneri L2 TaxID=1193729 RepID=K7Z517_9PROT|nr:bifunctional phosphopantothenoylcysteine decarboxylase/phosphopantothenate--cysteine ligase CoaBC [Candidatus Endolissoclinum faulkneri]AFX99143.1 phosphopantothenoylcysteine decarboxylase/phosphopantothenate--cysteine ligase [Candidatus Endolissoclinum faulkneri L2]
MTLDNKRIILIVGGGIAAYKALDLTRCLRDRGAIVRAILTKAGEHFVTQLSLSVLTENKVYTKLFESTNDLEMKHIKLSRSADLIIIAPATADLIASMANGLCGDLASTLLLATDTDVLIAPAMNFRMWEHPATKTNLTTLISRGVRIVWPNKGYMACGEHGFGRMAEAIDIVKEAENYFLNRSGSLAGRKAIVTSGPTYEHIDPVRYITNRSSGKQGYSIAKALVDLGSEVTLISGPTSEPYPLGVNTVLIESASDMLAACEAALPVDIVVCAAAISDWRVNTISKHKIKKEVGSIKTLQLTENADILQTLSQKTEDRPDLMVGFAAETDNVVEHAMAKLIRKGCDWILANNVSLDDSTFGSDNNTIHLITSDKLENWPTMTKAEIAYRLASKIAEYFQSRLFT